MPFFRNNNNINNELFKNNELLLSELKCISCEKYMASPIFQCNNGHSLCKNCTSKNVCIQCGSNISNIRNIHLENIAFKVKYPCENLSGGCKLMFIHSELYEHQKRCGQRAHQCLLNNGKCTFTSTKEELVPHANYAHSKEKVMSKDSTFACQKFKDVNCYIRLISAYKEVFWFYHVKEQNTAFWTIQYLGPDINCSKYTFDFKIHYSDDLERYITFKKICCLKNNDDLNTNIFTSIVKIKMIDLENCLSDEGKAIFSIKIRKAKIQKETE